MVVLTWINFVLLGTVLTAGVWLFGAWEMWWFWGFVTLICLSMVVTGLRLMVGSGRQPVGRRFLLVLAGTVPFVVYACLSWMRAEVFMSAERSVLLFVSGITVAIGVAAGLDAPRRRLLFQVVFYNLVLAGLYGIVNHLFFGGTHVLWAEGFKMYAGRATGAYYCPDHFAGIMEILLGMALAQLVARGGTAFRRAASMAAILIAFAAIALSQSRGALLTLPVIFGGLIIWGPLQWPKEVRFSIRQVAISGGLLLLLATVLLGGSHIERLKSYGGGWGKHQAEVYKQQHGHPATLAEKTELRVKATLDALSRTSRGRMYGGAYRAWRSSPWLGIGAGMHQILWPHFAATPDGDRATGRWPTLANDDFHSYEVHSDWLQLLEEYGLIGLVLFLIPLGMVLFFLITGIRGVGKQKSEAADESFIYLLSALLALLAMGFHSLGDFNLQMPATTWLLSALLAIALTGEDTVAPGKDMA